MTLSALALGAGLAMPLAAQEGQSEEQIGDGATLEQSATDANGAADAVREAMTGATETLPEAGEDDVAVEAEVEALPGAEDAAAAVTDAMTGVTESLSPGPSEADLAAEEAARIAAEEEAARLAAEEEAARIAAEEEAARIAAEEEAARLAAAEAAAQAALAECMDTAGPPTAEASISEAAQRDALRALAAAQGACIAAAEALPEEGGPIYHLATIAQVTGEHRRAVRLYERAAEAGIGAAYARLGDYYNFGIRPVREDVAEAVALYRAGADLGDPESQTTLALMHQLGRGVPRDPERLLTLLGAAADQGYHFAQVRLAQILIDGEGLPDGADPAAGRARLVQAARAGSDEAIRALIDIYTDGVPGIAPNPVFRYRWTNVLAEAGDPQAIAARAFLIEQGLGTASDPERAAAEYVRALETGAVDPAEMRGTINGRVPPWERETALAFQAILQERGLYDGPLDAIVGRGTLAGARGLAE